MRGISTNKKLLAHWNLVLLFELPDLRRCLVSVHDRHDQVHENNIEHLALREVFVNHLDSFLSVEARLKLNSDAIELALNSLLDELVILNNAHELLAQRLSAILLLDLLVVAVSPLTDDFGQALVLGPRI